MTVYGILTALHLYKSITSRQLWTLVIVFGSALECAGNALRIQGHFHYLSININPYIAMQVIVVMTPVFFSAAQFAILGKVLQKIEKPLNPFSSKKVMVGFIIFDVIALLVQAAGSAIAAIAETNEDETRTGSNIVVAGLGVQLFAYLCFDAIIIYMIIRMSKYLKYQHPKEVILGYSVEHIELLRNGLLTTFISALLILLRSSYRLAEMIEGWIGPIATKEWLYYAWDAAPVSLAVALLYIWHPKGFLKDEE